MSDTPRTDAVAYNILPRTEAIVGADFARQLEREVNTEEIWSTRLGNRLEKVERELAEAKESIRIRDQQYKEALAAWNKDRDQWRSCAEELAKELAWWKQKMSTDDESTALTRFNQLKGQK